jgi:hypothetical protein
MKVDFCLTCAGADQFIFVPIWMKSADSVSAVIEANSWLQTTTANSLLVLLALHPLFRRRSLGCLCLFEKNPIEIQMRRCVSHLLQQFINLPFGPRKCPLVTIFMKQRVNEPGGCFTALYRL